MLKTGTTKQTQRFCPVSSIKQQCTKMQNCKPKKRQYREVYDRINQMYCVAHTQTQICVITYTLNPYLNQIPAHQRLCNDGGHRRAHTSKDHQVFWTITCGVEEGPQPFGIVTLQTETDIEESDTRMGGGLEEHKEGKNRRI